MTPVGLLTLSLTLTADPLVSVAQQALHAPPTWRVQVVEARAGLAPGCVATAASAGEPVKRSGVVPVSYEGKDARGRRCEAAGWARIRAWAPALVTTRAVKEGELLDGATVLQERELFSATEPIASLSEGARAATPLGRGTVLEVRHLLDRGPPIGANLPIVVVVGDLRVEQQGVRLSCRARACARLANGRRLEGELVDGKLVVSP